MRPAQISSGGQKSGQKFRSTRPDRRPGVSLLDLAAAQADARGAERESGLVVIAAAGILGRGHLVAADLIAGGTTRRDDLVTLA
jgi:hypothetical protein